MGSLLPRALQQRNAVCASGPAKLHFSCVPFCGMTPHCVFAGCMQLGCRFQAATIIAVGPRPGCHTGTEVSVALAVITVQVARADTRGVFGNF